jgi:hypothetical protein
MIELVLGLGTLAMGAIAWRLWTGARAASAALDLQDMIKSLAFDEATAGFELALMGLASSYSSDVPSRRPYHPYTYIVMAVALHSHALRCAGGPFSPTDRSKLRSILTSAVKTLQAGDVMGNFRKLRLAVEDFGIEETQPEYKAHELSEKLLHAYRFANSKCV